MGLAGVATAARVATSEFLSPGFQRVTVHFYDSALPETERFTGTICTSHLPTPESHGSTHYFIVHGRDFALADSEVTGVMHERLVTAFREDVEALGKLEVVLAETAPEDFYEISVATDGAAVAMRRHLLKRARREADRAGSSRY